MKSRTLSLAFLAAGMATAPMALAGQKDMTPTPWQGSVGDPVPLDWLDSEQIAKAALKFGGQSMTDERARTIVEANGFQLISWLTCAGLPGCAVFEVQGKRDDRIFRYIVSDARCKTIGDPVVIEIDPRGRPDLLGRQKQQGQPSAARTATSRPTIDTTPAPTEMGSVSTLPAEGGSATSCFGGFTALIRARQHNQFAVDRFGYTYTNEETFQVIEQGRWVGVLTMTVAAWRAPVPNTGMTEKGSAYAWLDEDDAVLASDQDVMQMIAASGATDEQAKRDMCGDRRDAKRTDLKLAAEVTTSAVHLLPIPNQITVNLEPGGVGVSFGKAVDFYATARNISLAVADAAAQATYEDCMENPGRYDPVNFPPEPGKYSLEGYLGFEKLAPETITLTGSCPITQTNQSSVQVGDTICTTSTSYACVNEDNDCKCKKTSQERVCTSG